MYRCATHIQAVAYTLPLLSCCLALTDVRTSITISLARPCKNAFLKLGMRGHRGHSAHSLPPRRFSVLGSIARSPLLPHVLSCSAGAWGLMRTIYFCIRQIRRNCHMEPFVFLLNNCLLNKQYIVFTINFANENIIYEFFLRQYLLTSNKIPILAITQTGHNG